MPEFQVLRKLGSGGFGVVWRCRTEAEGEEFAGKVLNSQDSDALKRFRREVRILTKLNHPRIVRVIATQLEEPPFWYLMPIYQHSLRALFPDVIANRTRITTIFLHVLEGIEYAHEQAIIH